MEDRVLKLYSRLSFYHQITVVKNAWKNPWTLASLSNCRQAVSKQLLWILNCFEKLWNALISFYLFIHLFIIIIFLRGETGEGIYHGWYDADEALSKGWWKTLAKENEVQIQI